MNDLFISVAKERILPVSAEIIDYPQEYTENQLYKLAVYVTKNIMNLYIIINSWNMEEISEDIKINIALDVLFPKEWLIIANTSPNFHLKLSKIIDQYKTDISEEGKTRIHKIVEFLCYEIIETMVITSGFIKMFDLTPEYITKAIEYDPILQKIIKNNNIYIVENIPNYNIINIQDITMSNKCNKLLRIYVQKMLDNLFTKLEEKKRSTLTIKDVKDFFNL